MTEMLIEKLAKRVDQLESRLIEELHSAISASEREYSEGVYGLAQSISEVVEKALEEEPASMTPDEYKERLRKITRLAFNGECTSWDLSRMLAEQILEVDKWLKELKKESTT